MRTKEIVTTFVDRVDKEKTYSLAELKKILTDVFKEQTKQEKDKKAPSAYNLFVKEEIARIKESNPTVDTKQLMKLAAEKWKENKEKK